MTKTPTCPHCGSSNLICSGWGFYTPKRRRYDMIAKTISEWRCLECDEEPNPYAVKQPEEPAPLEVEPVWIES